MQKLTTSPPPGPSNAETSPRYVRGGGNAGLIKRRSPRPSAKWYVWPAVGYVSLIVAFPILYSIITSMKENTAGGLFEGPWVGVENYWHLLAQDSQFHNAIVNTLYYSVSSVVIEVVTGMVLALILTQQFLFRGIVRALILIPFVMTPTAAALIWRLLMGTNGGYFNSVLESLGVGAVPWLSDPGVVIPSLVLIDVWQWTPFMAIIFLAGLVIIPEGLYEAASIDGAGGVRKFTSITLPLMVPIIVVAATLRATDALKAFDHIFILTGGGPANSSELLNIYAYKTAFEFGDMPYAAAVSVTFFVLVIAAISVILFASRRRKA